MSRFEPVLHVLDQMRPAELIALVYFLYLAIAGLALGRIRAAVASASALVVVATPHLAVFDLVWASAGAPFWLRLLWEAWPLVLLLLGYRLAGLFYTRPNAALERRLLHVDQRIADRVRRLVPSRGAAIARGWLELAYLCVYPLIPLGAIAVAFARSNEAVEGFWTVVLTAGFTCYGVLPWIQTRPPRWLEGPEGAAAHGVRRLNLAILERGSVGVNTLPSGHAATAVATALVVCSHAPLIGAAFLLVATSIAVATVVGRYHYAVDTALGVLVGVLAWLVIGV
jgi:membrane-associated phospholipid phosphatase